MRIFLLFFFFSISVFAFSQSRYTINGYIKDESGEDLVGATVFVEGLNTGTAANVYGFYSITLPAGKYNLVYSFVGYRDVIKAIELNQNLKADVVLTSDFLEIEAVEITAERKDRNIERAEMSTVRIQSKTVSQIPAIFGETDLIKTIQLLPGVQSSGEGFSGFHVRGGGADQNLILLDEATVYNASHLGGFFSVFNNDAIRDIQLYKGDLPARYGGRLSSLLDVRMKEGNQQKLAGTGGIGTISSRMTIEGPIQKDRSSFLLSGRRSYADLFLPLSPNEDVRDNVLYFYDLNAKVNFRLNDRNRFFFSAYAGRDVFGFAETFAMNWGNLTTTFRWNHLFSERLFVNFSAIRSNYDYRLESYLDVRGFAWTSEMKDHRLKADFTFFINPDNTLTFGSGTTYHFFDPGLVKGVGESTVFNDLKVPTTRALEHIAYIGNEQKISARLSANYGLRFTLFQNIGKGRVYDFDENYNSTGFTDYESFEVYNSYFGIEPRLALRYLIDANSSIKASYARTRQNLHLASVSTAGSPLDIWLPSSPNLKPQVADQVAFGYFRNFSQNTLEASVEVYYKSLQNQVAFKDHANILLNPEIEGEFRIGDGWSYGAEFFLRKQTGDLTGWISYTLSKTEYLVPEINSGLKFPADYDRRHDVSIVGSYQVSPRVVVSATWVYGTGKPVTFPVGRFEYGNVVVPIYSSRNAYRIEDYHRMDLSVILAGKNKAGRGAYGEWNFSIYNLYSRKNTWLISFQQNSENPDVTEAYKVYLFPIIPSITYNFHF